MTGNRLSALLLELVSLPHETEWVEFKHSQAAPKEIGEYISTLSNSAALVGKPLGYLVWGIEDATHKILGTSFKPKTVKVGNEELENWLARLLSPRIDFKIREFKYEGKDIVIFEVPAASYVPVRFSGEEYIRCGSYRKKLKDFPEKERKLWGKFNRESFEKGIALENVSSDEVLDSLHYTSYFDMTDQRLPDNRAGVLERLESEKFILSKPGEKYDITNLGAILFAKELSHFESLSRKALRVIIYKGNNRTETIREQAGVKGYAPGFQGILRFINDQLPENEEIPQALRKKVRMYPEIAVRELVANTIIHQDFSISGTGPMIEIFQDRIEITNPGIPLIDTMRFIDEPPRSRNEILASVMRRLNICEERGSGIDKVIFYVEAFQLPAPDFTVTKNHTKAVLFASKKLNQMDKNDKIRACYHHACLRYVSNEVMTNTSLRKRFNIEQRNYAIASRIINDSIEADLIKKYDPESTSKKDAKYVPFWA